MVLQVGVTDGDVQRTPGKITSIEENQVIVRVGTIKRKLFYDNEEVKAKVMKHDVPVSGVAEMQEDSLLSFTPHE